MMACQWYNNDILSNPLGSTGGTIQIDETALGKAKYHKGAALKRNCNWVVGAVDTKTKRLALQAVKERNANALIEFINKSVKKGSTIYTDKWPAYNGLTKEGFTHLTVNHKIQFTNRLSDGTTVHTQNIEARWGNMKKYLHMHYAHHRKFTDDYIQTYAARINVGNTYISGWTFIRIFKH